MSGKVWKTFSLPPPEKRIAGKRWFEKFTLTPKGQVQGADFYIIYRAGTFLNILAPVLAIIAYAISFLNHTYNFLPVLQELAAYPQMFGVFNYLSGVAGAIMLLSLIYFYLLFLVNVDFRTSNLLRYTSNKPCSVSWIKLAWFIILTLSIPFLLVNLEGALGVLYVYKASFQSVYDNPVFVFVTAVFTSLCLTALAQAYFAFFIGFSYVLHERLRDFIANRNKPGEKS